MLPPLRKSYANILIVLFFVLELYSNVPSTEAGVTEEQMWSTANLMRDVCLPKFPKISKDVADGIRSGNIPEDKDVKCYINCIMEMMQTLKKGKFNLEASLKQVDLLLPDDMKQEYRDGFHSCKSASVGIKNPCDSAYAMLQCLRGKINRFIFP